MPRTRWKRRLGLHQRLAIFLIAAAVFVGWLWYASPISASHYTKALPAELGDVRYEVSRSDASWFEIFLPIRHESCGGALFRLSQTTLDAIADQGLAFFDNARQGRGYKQGRDRNWSYYHYQPWQETPAAPDWTSEGMWIGLHCLQLGDLAIEIRDAARMPGSYYTTKSEAELLVVPALGLAVFTFFG